MRTALNNLYHIIFYPIMLMYGKEASSQKQQIDRQHHTIPNQRTRDEKTSIVEMCITGYGIPLIPF